MKRVVLGFLGVNLDRPKGRDRWAHWRPSLSLCRREDFIVDRFELLYPPNHLKLATQLQDDMATVSPETTLSAQPFPLQDPWDFEEVYGALHSFCRGYEFRPEEEEYFVHITTGTHVQQICLFLLTESRHLPAQLIQSSPPEAHKKQSVGRMQVIDLDLSRYDRLAARFAEERSEAQVFLKSGIATLNEDFNRQIERLDQVAAATTAPILLMGPTGAGKSSLAARVHELKKSQHRLSGRFVEVNCATLRGEGANSALFGHIAGAFTGARAARDGLLKTADGGILFLDEIGELGLDEQAMLLRALEEGRFLPLGADIEVASEFQLIAGTNRDLRIDVESGRFREDLFARINLWTFYLPSLRERLEDLEPNLDYELEKLARKGGRRLRFNKEARQRYLDFAVSREALWRGNFRDLNASVLRMTTLSRSERIDVETVDEEIGRLRDLWGPYDKPGPSASALAQLLPTESLVALDLFDRLQLEQVVAQCRNCSSLSEAGRRLFQASRLEKIKANDADRLRKYLARFGLDFKDL